MKAEDISTLKNLSQQAKRYLDIFLTEPLAFRVQAEPGWHLVVFAPSGPDDIIIDLIPIKQWGSFTSLSILNDINDKVLIQGQQEATQPLIPDDYDGPLLSYINELRFLYPNWNKVMPPSSIFGCLSPKNIKSKDQIYNECKAYYLKGKQLIEKELKTQGEDLIDVLHNLVKVDKNTLN